MKKILFLFLMVALAAPVFSQSQTVKSKVQTLMNDEPKVKDHVLTDVSVLYAAVSDDGSNRNGYAEYLYYLLKDEGVKVVKVVIVKYGSQKDPKRDNAYGVKLGEFNP